MSEQGSAQLSTLQRPASDDKEAWILGVPVKILQRV
jgi:hypothetical protein